MKVKLEPLTEEGELQKLQGWAIVVRDDDGETYFFKVADAGGKVNLDELEKFLPFVQGVFDGVRLLA